MKLSSKVRRIRLVGRVNAEGPPGNAPFLKSLCDSNMMPYKRSEINITNPDYHSVLAFLYDKAAPFGTITKCVDYAGVLIIKFPY